MRLIRESGCDDSVSRRGAILVLSAVFMIVILAFATFSVDFGYIVLVNQELQSAVDSAALAAAQELQLAPDGGEDQVVDAAVDLAAANQVDGRDLVLQPSTDVEIGIWDELSRQFTPFTGTDLTLANAVRVSGKLSQARQNAVNLFFAPVLGDGTHEVTESAIAVIGRTRMRDVMLVIDCSGSMSSYNRMVYTRAASLVLIDELGEDDRLGLAVYSYPITETTTIEVEVKGKEKGKKKGKGKKTVTQTVTTTRLTGYLERNLQSDKQATRARIPHLDPGLYASTTCIGGGMRVAIEEFLANPRVDPLGNPVEQVMVLMTDGQANETEPPGADPIDSIYYYAELARQNGIIIHGITLGRNAQSLAIEDAADTTGGQYHHVSDNDFEGLFEVYRGIGRGGEQPRLVR